MSAGTVTLERNNRVIVASPAHLVGPSEMGREQAWAEGIIRSNPLYAWIMGSFVGAEAPNANGHMFHTADLRVANSSLTNAPLNMLHRPHNILGSYAGAELVYPTGAPAAAAQGAGLPFVESLAAMWRYYFPEEYASIKVFHEAGLLAQSMECIPKTLTCATAECGQEYAYAGRVSDTYTCGHLHANAAPRWLNKPLFSAGAIVVPPAVPAWRGAKVTEVAAGRAQAEQLRTAEAEGLSAELYAMVAAALPNHSEAQLESVMAQLMELSGKAEEAKKKAKMPWVPPWEKKKDPDKAGDATMDKADQPHAHQDTDPEKVDSPCKICGRDADSPIHQGMGNGLAASVEDGTAAMICLVPSPEEAASLALSMPGALTAADLHITLAYLGADVVSAWTEDQRARLVAVVQQWAAEEQPFAAIVSGLARLSTKDGTWPLVGVISSDELGGMRERLVSALTYAGLWDESDGLDIRAH